MAYMCEICEKSTSIGRSQQHKRGVAGKRWRDRTTATPRTFKPNLRKATFVIKGEEKQMRVCAKCLKRVRKFGAIKDYKNIAVV